MPELASIVAPNVDVAAAYTQDVAVQSQGLGFSIIDWFVPSGFYAMPITYFVNYRTDATVINRTISFIVDTPEAGATLRLVAIPSPVDQPANSTWQYTFAADTPTVSSSLSTTVAVEIPRLLVAPTGRIRAEANNAQAGDRFVGPATLRVALFPWGTTPPVASATVTPLPL